MHSITFSKPVDEDGNIIEGLSYSVRYGTTEASGGMYGVPTNATETSVEDTGDTLSFTITGIATGETYYVCPVAETSDGQRNGEEFWFTRE